MPNASVISTSTADRGNEAADEEQKIALVAAESGPIYESA
jgi:hypothetical protein